MTLDRNELDFTRLIVERAATLNFQPAKDHATTLTLDLLNAEGRAGNPPLNYAQLLTFDDQQFLHDVAGIWSHMDRNTRKLDPLFAPRCSVPANNSAHLVPHFYERPSDNLAQYRADAIDRQQVRGDWLQFRGDRLIDSELVADFPCVYIWRGDNADDLGLDPWHICDDFDYWLDCRPLTFVKSVKVFVERGHLTAAGLDAGTNYETVRQAKLERIRATGPRLVKGVAS